ncbi:MAG: hypothetical protein H3C47_06330 [Candidatus Cloacimonetes bacterium]|nr:hypothetical protein [Candidatus Cloacimonadota bacterium]
MKRTLILVFALILGIFTVLASLLNAMAFDLLKAGFANTRFDSYEISTAEVNGGLFGGFFITNLSLKEKNSQQSIISMDTLFAKVDLFKLIAGELSVSWARIDRLKVSAPGLRDMIARKDLQKAFSGTSGSLLDSLVLKNIHFYELSFDSPHELYLTDEQIEWFEDYMEPGFTPRFVGELDWREQRLSVNAHLSTKSPGPRPLNMDFTLDTKNMVGQIVLQAKGVSLEELIRFRQPIDGEISMQTSLNFALDPNRFESPHVFTSPAGDLFYYTLQGESEGEFSVLQIGDVVASKVLLQGHWNHKEATLKHGSMEILGTQILASGQWKQDDKPRFVVVVPGIEVSELLHSLEFSDISHRVRGQISMDLQWDGETVDLGKIQIQNLKFDDFDLQLGEVHLLNLNPYLAGEDQDLVFLMEQFSAPWFSGTKLNGSLNENHLKLSALINQLDMGLLSRILPESAGAVKGEIQAGLEVSFDLNSREFTWKSQGRISKIECREVELDSMNFMLEGNLDEAELRGDLRLLDKSQILLTGKFSELAGELNLFTPILDFKWFKPYVPEVEFSGQLVDLKADVSLWPESGFRLKSRAQALDLEGIRLDDAALEMAYRQGKYWMKLMDRSLRINLVQKADGIDFSMAETNLARLAMPFLPQGFLRLDGGEIALDGFFGSNGSQIILKRFKLGIGSNELILNRQSQLVYGLDNTLSGGLGLSLTQGRNQPSADLDMVLGKDQIVLNVRGLKTQNLTTQLQADLNMDLVMTHPLDSLKRQLNTTMTLTNVNLFIQDKPVFVDEFRFAGQVNSQQIKIDKSIIRRLSSQIQIHGIAPLPKQTGPLQLAIKIPKTDMKFFKPLLPDQVLNLDGTIDLDMTVSGSFEKPDFAGRVKIENGSLGILYNQESLNLSSVFLDAGVLSSIMDIREFKTRVKDTDLLLRGKIDLWEKTLRLTGGAAQAALNLGWLKLEGPEILNLSVGGTVFSPVIQGIVNYRDGVFLYEEFVRHLAEPTHQGQFRFPKDWTVDLSILKPKGKSLLRAEFFQAELEPSFILSWKKDQLVLDGSVMAIKGRIDLARNRFDLDQGSNLKFVPRVVSDAGTEKKNLWESRQFAKASVVDKLSLMWQERFPVGQRGQNVNSSYPFETVLNVRAFARNFGSNLELSLSGPISDLRPLILADGRALSGEEWLKVLAPSRPGASSVLPAKKRLSAREEEEQMSEQVASTIEEQLLGKHFESILGEIFKLDGFRLQSNYLGSQAGALDGSRLRLGTSLGEGVDVIHEQETSRGGLIRNRTQLEFHLNEKVDLILERSSEVDRENLDLKSNSEKDFQFGVKHKIRF